MVYNICMTEQANSKNIQKEAARWIGRKANQQKLIAAFVDSRTYKPADAPIIIFMAGSPGAGKTEFVKELKSLDAKGKLSGGNSFTVIDPDAIREYLPGYMGNNSHLFQNAISIGVGMLFRNAVRNKQNVIVDGTFANYKLVQENVKNVIKNNCTPVIFYIFQHPVVAWDFTQKREAVEGRRIHKSDFIDKFIAAKDTVLKVKNEFGDKVVLNMIIKDYKDSKYNKKIEKVFVDVDEIEKYTRFNYDKKVIERLLQ